MSASQEFTPRSRNAWRALTLLLIVEAIGGVVVLIPTVQAAFAQSADPAVQRISIVVAAVLAWLWVCITLGGALRIRAGWVRGSALTIHVLLFAAGTGVLQFQLADLAVGWGLIALAFAGFAAAILARPSDAPPSQEEIDG